jgi:hypothetical protein
MCYFYGDFAYLSVHSRSEPYDYAPLLETSDYFSGGRRASEFRRLYVDRGRLSGFHCRKR